MACPDCLLVLAACARNCRLTVVIAIVLATLPVACSTKAPVLAKNLHVPEASWLLDAGRITPPASSDGVQRVQDLLLALERFDRTGRNRQLQEISFELPESDINEYLAYTLHHTPRPGIEAAKVRFHDHNRVSTSVVLNFDCIAGWAPLISNLLQMTGKRVLDVDIVFTVQDSAVTFQFVDDQQNDVMARRTLQMLLHVLALHQPERYDTSKPIPLPFGLQRLSTSEGRMAGGT